jgi:ABC-type sugar transport system permease subunit
MSMAVPESASASIRWALTLLLPVVVAILLPGTARARRSRRRLTAVQVVGLALALIGLITPVLLFPVALVLMFCAIFNGVLQILSQFTTGFHCPDLPPASHADVLIQPGVALLLFATARKWRLAS